MARKKATATKVETMNAAPGYTAPASMPGGYGAPSSLTQPGGPFGMPAPPNGNGNVQFSAPPPPPPKNPFVNAQFLWQRNGQAQATIQGVRAAQGGNSQYGNRAGFFLDCVLADGTACTARVNVGDTRHQKLYAKFGPNIIGQRITFRLTNPGDQTKAPWTID